MDRDRQIQMMDGAERRASAFLDRILANPVARAVLKRGNPDRHQAPREETPTTQRRACG